MDKITLSRSNRLIFGPLALLHCWDPEQDYDAGKALVAFCIARFGPRYSLPQWQECKQIIDSIVRNHLNTPVFLENHEPTWAGVQWRLGYYFYLLSNYPHFIEIQSLSLEPCCEQVPPELLPIGTRATVTSWNLHFDGEPVPVGGDWSGWGSDPGPFFQEVLS